MSVAKEALETRDKLLDEYERGVGISRYNSPGTETELEQYLSMDRIHIEALSVDECGIIAMRLCQFAFHIQRAQNRELARASWAKNQINISTANTLQGYKGYGREEKLWQAIKESEYATDMHKIQTYAEQRATRLNFMSNGLNNLAEMVKSIKFNKLRADK